MILQSVSVCHEFHELARIKLVEIREIRGKLIFIIFLRTNQFLFHPFEQPASHQEFSLRNSCKN